MKQVQSKIERFVLAAKAVLYDADRGGKLLDMMKTEDGAVMAVHTVMGGIDQQQNIPREIAPLVAAAIFGVMLDMFKAVEGRMPPDDAISHMTQKIMEDATNSANNGPLQPPKEEQPQQPQQQPQGIVQGAMQ